MMHLYSPFVLSSQFAMQFYIFQLVGRDAYLIPGVLIACVSVIANLAVIILTLLSSRLRKTTKHLVILNISVVALLHNVFPEALFIELYAREKWIHGCDVLFIVEVASIVTSAIYVLLMMTLCVEYIISGSCITCSFTVKYVIISAMVGFCWVVNSLVIIPVAAEGRSMDICGFALDKHFSIAINVLNYFPQAVLTVMAVVSLVAIYCLKRGSSKSDHVGIIQPFPVDVVAACCVTVILKFPFGVILLISDWISIEISEYKLVHVVALPLFFLPHAVVPFVWLMCRETREAVRAIFGKSRDPIEFPMDNIITE